MLKLFKDCFKITNDCIILVTPLIIFLSILSWYVNFAFNSIDDATKLLLGVVTLFVMFCGFFASWIYMIKKTITLSKKVYIFDNDRAKDLQQLIIALPKGIGKLILPIMCTVSIYIFIYFGLYCILNFFISKYVGYIDFSEIDFDAISLSSKELLETVNDFDLSDMKIFALWYFSSAILVNFVTFLTILWIPEIVYSTKNAIKALFSSIKKVFMNFKSVLCLYLFIFVIVKLLSIINTILLLVPILYFFVLIITYYFIVYLVVLLFTYYELNFAKEE